MHHAVSLVPTFCVYIVLSLRFRSSRRQMVDKIWSDWQKRSPENANSFFGGSVQALQSFQSYTQYPNGSPPYLNVRFHPRVLDLVSKSMDMCR